MRLAWLRGNRLACLSRQGGAPTTQGLVHRTRTGGGPATPAACARRRPPRNIGGGLLERCDRIGAVAVAIQRELRARQAEPVEADEQADGHCDGAEQEPRAARIRPRRGRLRYEVGDMLRHAVVAASPIVPAATSTGRGRARSAGSSSFEQVSLAETVVVVVTRQVTRFRESTPLPESAGAVRTRSLPRRLASYKASSAERTS